ncbi:MAG TPA: hypothetical protein VMU53_17920 [Candidatus Sulfotelmatobacter sp.]|nr:hypothetical protein [Candidatus Sulfotelmatobacter sp.]
MVHAEQIQEVKTTIEFTLPLTDDRKMDPAPSAATSGGLAVALPAMETDGIVLSGTQVLWSCVSALSFVALLLWAALKLWMYE